VTARSIRRPLVAAVLLLPATACSSHASGTPDANQVTAAADTSICVDDATTVSSFPDDYPQDFPMPTGTVVYHVEDRGQDGVIATGITATPFDAVLEAMNNAKHAGFTVTTGETEDDDAEANWTGHGYLGRWAIKKSASCPDQTVIQLLAKRN
jgi:hypothetical protein